MIPKTSDPSDPATPWRRWVAYLLDSVLLVLITVATFYVLIYHRLLWLALVLTCVEALYKPVMEARYGWTFGKLSQKIRVVDATTRGKIDFNQALLRYLPWAFGFFASVFVLIRHTQDPNFVEVSDYRGYLEFARASVLNDSWVLQIIQQVPFISAVWLFLDPLRQAAHDKVANSLVVNFGE